ncbi:MAG TPA: DUF2752 domain-containing protein [Streptosporangiaceae bacterium]
MDVGIAARVERIDRHRVIGVLTVVGLAVGALIAIFGLPPLEVHSPLRLFGMVCPFCGATRAVQALLQGDPHTAWHYNPIAFAVVIGGAAVVVRLAAGLFTGRWLNIRMTRPRLVYAVGAVLFVALWVNQAQHAAMLRADDGSLLSEMFGMSTVVVLGSGATLIYLAIATRKLRAAVARAAAADSGAAAEDAGGAPRSGR